MAENILKSRRLRLAAAIIAAPTGAAIYYFHQQAHPTADSTAEVAAAVAAATKATAVSFTIVAIFVVLFLIFTEVVGRKSSTPKRQAYGYLEVLIGADGYASTSKAVAWLWTLIFGSCLVFLSAMTWTGNLTVESAFGGEWSSYMLLLGGPFAAAVAAKGIASTGSGPGSIGQSTSAASISAVGITPAAADTKPQVTDLGTNAAGDSSLSDLQYVVFSLVAITYFVGAFVSRVNSYATTACPADIKLAPKCATALTLPDIPSALLGLTSLAALTYVGAKATAKNGIRIATITPGTVGTGQTLSITVVNAPTDANQSTISITFSIDNTSFTTAPSADPQRTGALLAVSTIAPPTAGDYQVTVMTPDGASGPHPLKVT